MKKIFIFTIIFLVLFSSSSFAFENADSKYWNELDEREKEIYLRGLADGFNSIFLMKTVYDEANKFDSFYELINKLEQNNEFSTISNEEKEKLNNYFEEGNNTIFEYFAKDIFQSTKEKTNSNKNLIQYEGMQTKLDAFEVMLPTRTGTIGIVFSNNHSKRLTGLEYQLTLYDPFGDIILNEERKIDFIIEANTKEFDFYNFLEIKNPKLFALIKNDTLNVEVKILRAVFEDGQIINL